MNPLNKIEKLINFTNYLTELIETSNERVVSYCHFLQNEIDICTESQIMQLNNYRDQMLNDIKSYHDRCIEYEKKEQLQALAASIEEIKTKCVLLREKLEKNENEIIFNEELDTFDFVLNQKKIALNDLIFSERKLIFLDTNLEIKAANIGRLGYEFNTTDPFKLSNIEEITPIKVNYLRKLDSAKAIDKISFHEAFDHLISIVYTSATKTLFGVPCVKLVLSLYNFSGELLKETTVESELLNVLCLTSTLNRIVVATEKSEKSSKLQAFDENLNLKTKITLDYSIKSIHSQNTKIYLFTKKLLFLHIFNENLQEIFTLGQNINPSTAFYIQPDSKLSLVENFMIAYEKNILRVNKNGYALRAIEIINHNKQFDYFQAITALKYLFINYRDKQLFIYDFNGVNVEKCFIKEQTNISDGFLSKKNYLTLLNSNDACFYIYKK